MGAFMESVQRIEWLSVFRQASSKKDFDVEEDSTRDHRATGNPPRLHPWGHLPRRHSDAHATDVFMLWVFGD